MKAGRCRRSGEGSRLCGAGRRGYDLAARCAFRARSYAARAGITIRKFATEYYSAKQELAESAALVRQLDEARTRHRMSKATLARKAAISPETVRKLFTAGGNPEIRTVARLAAPLGLRLLLGKRPVAKRPVRSVRGASRQSAARVAR